MNQTSKESFHRLSAELEDLLRKYKKSFPYNYGSLLRRYAAFSFAIIVPLVFVSYVSKRDLEPTTNSIVLSVLIALAAYGLIVFFHRKPKGDSDVLPDILDTQEKLKSYEEYPDVKEYLKCYEDELQKAAVQKNKFIKNTNIIFGALLLLGIVVFLVDMAHTRSVRYELLSNVRDTGKYYDLLDLESEVPFFTMKPYKTDISGVNAKLESQTVDVYFVETVTSPYLRIPTPKISGGVDVDVFRLIITDENGKAVNLCPPIDFSATANVKFVDSYLICDFGGTSFDKAFDVKKTLLYLKEHKDNLRFIVQKLF
ncbi:MAG: hypothetical protein J6U21_01655 [Bacteroidales bacterium]|nr:hypothetical protein [Bacteroidales bacterium]MBP5683520.1 hypothetical protein [Bacteroidales bacterium]